MRKDVYTICYWREKNRSKKMLEITESIVAESWQDAMQYWQIEFEDAGADVRWIKKGEPILSVTPAQDRKPFAPKDEEKSN